MKNIFYLVSNPDAMGTSTIADCLAVVTVLDLFYICIGSSMRLLPNAAPILEHWELYDNRYRAAEDVQQRFADINQPVEWSDIRAHIDAKEKEKMGR